MSRPPVTLLVPPFEILSEEEAWAGVARGFVLDLIVELARFPQVAVIAVESAESARRYVETRDDEGQFCRLSGSFRRWGDGVRINLRLEDVRDGRHLWAGRYDGGPLHELHDEITARVVNALTAGVDQTLLIRARRRPPETLEAYECWLRGMDFLQRGCPDADSEARAWFDQALRIDPHFAQAQAGISLSHFNEWSCQAWGKWEEKEAAAYEAALRAEAMDPHNARVQIVLSRIEQYRREFDRAGPRLERALALAPNDAAVLIQLGLGVTLQGDAERGAELSRRALDLNPLGPPWWHAFAAVAHFALGRFENCLAHGAKSPPNVIVDTPAFLAAASAHLGRDEDAARHLRAFRDDFARRIAGGRSCSEDELLRWLLHVNPFRDPAHTRLLANGVTRAGLAGSWERPVLREPVPWTIANTFRMEGAAWTLVYEHQAVTLPDLRGLHDLALLLSRPGEALSSAELAGAKVHAIGLERADPAALRAYRERLREIEADFVEAEERADAAGAARLEEEKAALLGELSRVAGLGGRLRQTGGVADRARGAVTWRIRHAIRKIAEVHPALGRHLGNAVRTGSACGYFPEKPVSWHL
ncbi:MAG: hypothetical protein ACKV19_16190 [Verrucomicrobiales bacterium]